MIGKAMASGGAAGARVKRSRPQRRSVRHAGLVLDAPSPSRGMRRPVPRRPIAGAVAPGQMAGHGQRRNRPNAGSTSARNAAVATRTIRRRAWSASQPLRPRPNCVNTTNRSRFGRAWRSAGSNPAAFSSSNRLSVSTCSRSQAAFAPNLPLG